MKHQRVEYCIRITAGKYSRVFYSRTMKRVKELIRLHFSQGDTSFISIKRARDGLVTDSYFVTPKGKIVKETRYLDKYDHFLIRHGLSI